MLLHKLSCIGLCILACVLTLISILGTQDIRIQGFVSLSCGLFLLVHCSYRSELKKELYDSTKKNE